MKKTTCITLVGLLMACSQALANFSGGDNFNDNSMDMGKWSLFEGDTDRYLTEASGRLEAKATSGANDPDSGSWEWISNAGSYTQDWSVTYETTINMDETSISDIVWIGFVVQSPAGSSEVFLEHIITPDNGGEHMAGGGAISMGSTDYESLFDVANPTVSLRATYEVASKTIHTWYSEGNGFFPVGSSSVTNWGMSAGDQFRLLVFGGGEGEAIGSGQVYGDNLVLNPYSEFYPTEEEARIPCSSIVGSWIAGDSTTKDSVMMTFLTDGSYFLAHDGIADGGGQPGMERGTYSWNTNSGLFTHSTTVDTCGDWGLSHTTPTDTVSIVGNTMYLTVPDEGTFPLQRVYHPTTPPSIVGGWSHLDTVNNHDNVVFSFLPNGIYFFSQDGDSAYDPSGQDGMERGVYTWDAATGAFSATALTDTSGAWGPDEVTEITVSGNTLAIGGTPFLTRVVDSQCSDLDGDGLPDVWELQYYGNPTNATAGGNGDGDELDDRSEFIAGTNPTNGGSIFAVSDPGPSPSGYVLNWTVVEGRSYGVKWTDSLTNSFSVLTNGLSYPQNSYTDTVHSAEGGGFYRVEVKLEK